MAETTFHLEMKCRNAFRPSQAKPELSLEPLRREGAANQRLYQEVGKPWQWTDRLSWTAEQWQSWADRPEVITYLALFSGKEAGYAELEKQADGNVEIVYFGLKENHFGKGLGGSFLSAVIQAAWDFTDTQRLWVHTCTNDHEYALANYQSRGFEIFRIEED